MDEQRNRNISYGPYSELFAPTRLSLPIPLLPRRQKEFPQRDRPLIN